MVKKQEPVLMINGYSISQTSPMDALASIFECTPNIDCWSYPALKEFYIGSIQIVCDWCTEMKKVMSKKARYTKFINQAKQLIHYTPREREDLVRKIYETILINSNLGTLRGFGISNTFGDNIKGDPERRALRDTDNLL